MMGKMFTLGPMVLILSAFAAEAQEPSAPNPPQSKPMAIKRFSDRDLGPGASKQSSAYTSLLNNPLVVEEIHFTDEQKAKLKEVERLQAEAYRIHSEERHKQMDEYVEKNKMNDPASRTPEKVRELNSLNLEMAIGSNEIVAEFDAKIARNILNRQQAKRLQEIRIQALGAAYFNSSEARETLALEPDQALEISKLFGNLNRQESSLRVIPARATQPTEGSTPTPESKLYDQSLEAARKNVIQLRLATMRSIEQILTKPQRGAYKAAVGKPFSFTKPKDEKPEESTSTDEKAKK